VTTTTGRSQSASGASESDASDAGERSAAEAAQAGDRPSTTTGVEAGFSALAGIATAAVAIILLVEVFLAPPATWGGRDNPGAWNPPRSRAELLVAKMDGHTFAETATDPTMRDTPRAYFGDRVAAAYRSSRPVQGWLDFVFSAGGRRPLLAPAILVLTALTAGAAVLSTAALGRATGRRIRYLASLMATPAFIAAVAYPGICEPLAIALALGGITAWLKDRPWLAVGLLCAAALTRETMLLVPLGLGVAHLVRTRRLMGALKLGIPAGAYAAWTVVVRARIGAWPSDNSQADGLLVGLREAIPHWHLAEYAAAALVVASALVIAVCGTDWMRAIAALHVPVLALANYQVWWVWFGFARVAMLLPVFALICLGTPLGREPAVGVSRRASPGERCSSHLSVVSGPSPEV